MSSLVVVNASPLIGLLAIGREGLLPALFSKILVPTAVREEILAGAAKDANAERLGDCDWAVSPPDETMPETVLAWGLGGGNPLCSRWHIASARWRFWTISRRGGVRGFWMCRFVGPAVFWFWRRAVA